MKHTALLSSLAAAAVVTAYALRAGIQPGDVILAINNTPVKSAHQLREQVGKSSKNVALLVQRDNAKLFVPVNIG